MKNKIVMSALGKTWLFDLDGTVLKHNGYKIDGKDSLLDGAKEFFETIPKTDTVIFLTSRTKEYSEITERFLNEQGIHFSYIIYNLPYGERVLINDNKPSGLKMAHAISTNRDTFMETEIEIDKNI